MSDLEIIKNKCEQYWNEVGVGDPEFHVILEFIHRHATAAAAEIERLESELVEVKAERVAKRDNF